MWYVGQLKSGGLVVFQPQHALDSESRGDLRERWRWVSLAFSSAEKASRFLQKQIGHLENPPATLTVVHKGTVHVQHLSDTKSFSQRLRIAQASKKKKNPPRNWHEKELKSLTGLMTVAQDIGLSKIDVATLLGALRQEKQAIREHDRRDKIIASNPKKNAPDATYSMYLTMKHKDLQKIQKEKIGPYTLERAETVFPPIREIYEGMGYKIISMKIL